MCPNNSVQRLFFVGILSDFSSLPKTWASSSVYSILNTELRNGRRWVLQRVFNGTTNHWYLLKFWIYGSNWVNIRFGFLLNEWNYAWERFWFRAGCFILSLVARMSGIIFMVSIIVAQPLWSISLCSPPARKHGDWIWHKIIVFDSL